MKKSEHLQLGKRGEDAAEEFLLAKGFHILFRNYRFQKAEVDIVASYNNLLVLIEVKTRRSNNFGNPEEFVSKRKQELFYEASEEFLTEHQLDYEVRFDVVSIIGTNPPFEIEHIEDAF